MTVSSILLELLVVLLIFLAIDYGTVESLRKTFGQFVGCPPSYSYKTFLFVRFLMIVSAAVAMTVGRVKDSTYFAALGVIFVIGAILISSFKIISEFVRLDRN